MSKAYVEIDFFQMEKQNNAFSKPSSPERAPSSLRGIQSVVSRINPQLLKTVMAAGAAGHTRMPSENVVTWQNGQLTPSSNPSSPKQAAGNATQPSTTAPLPVLNSVSRSSVRPATDTAPLTIFYNGAVTVLHVPRDKAEAIMRMAETTGVTGSPAERAENSLIEDHQLDDLPIARKKSLHRFLEKRKERLSSAAPYDKGHPISSRHVAQI